jgi:hypothetical protein
MERAAAKAGAGKAAGAVKVPAAGAMDTAGSAIASAPLRSGYIPAVLRDRPALQLTGRHARDQDTGEEHMTERMRKKNERGYLRRVFKRMDTNQDGFLDEEEVQSYLLRMGYDAMPSEVQNIASTLPKIVLSFCTDCRYKGQQCAVYIMAAIIIHSCLPVFES